MPSGQSLSKDIKRIIYSHFADKNESPEQIFRECFHEDTTIVALSTIVKLCAIFATRDDGLIQNCLEISKYPLKRLAGRKRKFSTDDSDNLVNIVETNGITNLKSIGTEYAIHYCHEDEWEPSTSTVYRELHRRGFTHKKAEIKNVLANPEAQLSYLEAVAFVPSEHLVDIDGTIQNPKDFHLNYGWSFKEEHVIKRQIKIGNTTFAILCAYTERGFLAYEIFNDTVTQHEVMEFIDTKLVPLLSENSYAILDNASNFKTENVRQSLENAFEGRYRYCAVYSSNLKPVELGISNVKHYIRTHQNIMNTYDDQVALIKEAFDAYSINGEYGHTAYNHFRQYRNNHDIFLAENN